MTARTSTQAHAHTCLRGQIVQDKKKEKKLGIYGLVILNFSHKKTKYLQYKHLFKTLSQTVTNQKNLKTFISFDSKELTYFYRNFTEKNKKMLKIGD